ncbi:DNA translocase FtsK [Fictibacillus nanhaiensis]|uniref:DNA translocase FtsK n=1 Tax=Fictibacillus nanhaiensis TaxID=742169 RepID=UPI001C981829|nr:DNA translocase FtsK [Fictibacillus nanhaiensis]MBY6035153.1 DNA translocase FtsK [Fictibacillus nanhaiensis]
MSWIKKLMNTFFDDENEDDSFYEQKDDKPLKKQSAPENKKVTDSKPTRTPTLKNGGRKPAQNHNQHPAKMLHKYPENGPFRFPVIPDQKTIKPPGERNTYQPRTSNNENVQVRNEERRPIQNETRRSTTKPDTKPQQTKRPAFKPTHVPSPVYGYEKKNKSLLDRSDETKNQVPEVKSRFTPTDVPSPVYGFGKRKPEGILFIGRDIPPPNSVAEELLQSVEKSLPAVPEQEAMISPDDRVFTNEEPLITNEETICEQAFTEQEVRDDKPTTIQTQGNIDLIPEQERSFERDENVDSYTEEEEEAESNENTVFEEYNPPIISDVHHENVAEEREPQEPQKQQDQQEQHKQQIQEVIPQTKREPMKSGGQYVPFNVLMLKKDRQTNMNQSARPKTEQPSVRPSSPTGVTEQHKNGNEEQSLCVPLSFLNKAKVSLEDDDIWLNEQKETLQSTLENFNVNAKVVHMTKGPAVTRFEVQPAPGVKVNKITNLTDDIKLSLAARDIRIEAPIPGKNAIGIEVPNQHSRAVFLREIIEQNVFKDSASSLTVALGLDISGAPVVTDLQKMPHGLIAGATGSGKSVCINSILISLLYKAKPEDVRLLLVDPKMVELAPYNHIPHLVTPVITDAKEATAALKWAVEEMERRYEEFAKTGVREIKRYNEKMEEERHFQNKMPYIVVVIDELADLMMVSPQEVEEAICRIAQKARACGIHLLLATQRPSVDVITGLIKANVPTRTAFAVSSAIDSRTILDMSGAERLLGRGDMLFMENGSNKAVRIQGTFVSDEEIEEVTRYVKEEYKTDYLFSREDLIQHQQNTEVEDELFEDACYYVIEVGAASSSSLQRRFRIGYNRAARLVDMMEGFGLVSEAMGSKPRHVLLTQEELENRLYSQVE